LRRTSIGRRAPELVRLLGKGALGGGRRAGAEVDRNSVHVDREPVQHPVFPGYLATQSLSSINGVAKQLIRVLGKPIVSGLDVASNPYFLVASCRRRTFPKPISQSVSDPTGMKVAIRDHQKVKWQGETVFGEPIESRVQINLVELLVLRLCHERVTFSGLFEQLMELVIGGESAFADVRKVSGKLIGKEPFLAM